MIGEDWICAEPTMDLRRSASVAPMPRRIETLLPSAHLPPGIIRAAFVSGYHERGALQPGRRDQWEDWSLQLRIPVR